MKSFSFSVVGQSHRFRNIAKHSVRFIFAASRQQYFFPTQNQHQPVNSTFLSQKISTGQPNTVKAGFFFGDKVKAGNGCAQLYIVFCRR